MENSKHHSKVTTMSCLFKNLNIIYNNGGTKTIRIIVSH